MLAMTYWGGSHLLELFKVIGLCLLPIVAVLATVMVATVVVPVLIALVSNAVVALGTMAVPMVLVKFGLLF